MKARSQLESTLPALSALEEVGLERWCREVGAPAYRARQMWSALHRRSVQAIEEMTELPRPFQARLSSEFRPRTLSPQIHLKSARDGAEKVLFELEDRATVESVLIRGRNSEGTVRHTVCVSSQVGCPAACSFCATGLSGFSRNLRAAEITDQVAYFTSRLRGEARRINNVVFMGMGEPFLNVDAVRGSIARLIDPRGYGLGARHITVSTVGIVPQILHFAEWGGQVNLAVSLHAPNDELRSRLVPYNQHFPIAELMDAVRTYLTRTHRRVSFEYVLLRGVNDELSLAAELSDLIRPFRGGAHVNLIPWNPFREGKFVRSEGPDAEAFARILERGGVRATIRYSKGLDISAACGQLREMTAASAGS